jgi:hypothetical protein
LGGLNLEATLLIQLSVQSPLYQEAFQYLQAIRRLCDPFDISQIDYYKRLQSMDEEEGVLSLELYGGGAGSLEKTTIAIFGDNESDLSNVRALKPVKLTAFDMENTAYNYSGVILHNGPLASYSPTAAGVFLSRRRCAVRRGGRIPILTGVQEIEPWVMDTSKYFVSVQVDNLEPDVVAHDVPASAWQPVNPDASPLLARLPDSERQFVFEGRKPQSLHRLQSFAVLSDICSFSFVVGIGPSRQAQVVWQHGRIGGVLATSEGGLSDSSEISGPFPQEQG